MALQGWKYEWKDKSIDSCNCIKWLRDKPYLNLVNTKSNVGNSNKVYTSSDGLFNSNFVEKNISNSIEGATALKLDESFEIKNSQEQSNLIDRFEKSEENEIAEGLKQKILNQMNFQLEYL